MRSLLLSRVLITSRNRFSSYFSSKSSSFPPSSAHGINCPCCLRKGHQVSAQGLNRVRSDDHVLSFSSSSTSSTFEYAFEMAASSVRVGRGVIFNELGFDCAGLLEHSAVPKNAQPFVALFADPHLASLDHGAVADARASLERAKVAYKIFDDISVEPSKSSFERAIAWARIERPAVFVAVGGGSTMDTAKVAALYQVHNDADFIDFVNAPVGRGLPVMRNLPPLVCAPTTSGTGSETTGVAVFDWFDAETGVSSKTGIASPKLRPLMGLIDPSATDTLPPAVATAAAFDVLAHALESLTATPYHQRQPRPEHPKDRPAYQGSNPIADGWSLAALSILRDHLLPAVLDSDAEESRAQLMLAATMAGVGFGSAGVHLCHGLSYPVSSLVKQRGSFNAPGYPGRAKDAPASAGSGLLPHGMSVILHAPAVFRWTAVADPIRHLTAARALGVKGTEQLDASASEAHISDRIGHLLADHIQLLMQKLSVPNGLSAVGITDEDVATLVQGTLPQHRVTKLSPRPVDASSLEELFANSM